jgi:transglutaminase-like putative cysteine protease
MKRRDFMKLGGVGTVLAAIAPRVRAAYDDMAVWRGFRFTYLVELPPEGGPARLWLPMPYGEDSIYQRSMGAVWNGKADKAVFQKMAGGGTLFYAEWRGKGPRSVTVSAIVKTAERVPDLGRVQVGAPVPPEAQSFLKASRQFPTDGAVRSKAQAITKGANGSLEKARAIYEWVVENARFDAVAASCQQGGVRGMLESGPLGGRSADINGLFVALCRAAGVPARLQYGIRVDESELSKSLGAYGDVSRAQHCAAEFHLAGAGWVPADPAAVAEAVALDSLAAGDPKVALLRTKLFGTSEMNWFAFNHAEEVALAPDAAAGTLPFFALPHGEIARKPRDSSDPANFAYRIESRELVGTGGKF